MELGAGCGILSIGCVMLGAEHVTALELDCDAIDDLTGNLAEFEIDSVDVLQCDVTSPSLLFRWVKCSFSPASIPLARISTIVNHFKL